MKKLLPLGEPQAGVGAARQLRAGIADRSSRPVATRTEELREREAIYPLSEGLTSRRMAALAAQAVERAPVLPEWIEPG